MNQFVRDLYHDMCTSNCIIPDIKALTKNQVDTLISLQNNGMRSEIAPSGMRRWIIPGKKKQGGHLTQSFARDFFSSEK